MSNHKTKEFNMQPNETDTMLPVWNKAVTNLEKVIPPQNYTNWIQPIRFSHSEDSTVFVNVPNQFFKVWLEDNYIDLINSAISIVAEKNISVTFSVHERESEYIEKTPETFNIKKQIVKSNPQEETKTEIPEYHVASLNPKYTFEQFVSGSGNQFAHAAAQAVANNPANTYNPLFIYGGVGLGKSHLLNAIGHKILSDNPSTRVCYCSSEKFMHEMVNFIKLNRLEEFRERYRTVDLLLIDDIQFISGRERTQEVFFHTFNALYEAHKQIVITSDKFPKEIPKLEERLRSRFEWGLIADIQPPDLETKIAILKKKAETNRIRLPDEVAMFLASSDTRNIRELEGMLIRLGAYSSLQNVPITMQMARHNLKDILVDKKKEITVELIQKTVADHFDLKVADLKSEKRLKTFVQARQIAVWLCRDMTSASYPDIGQKFGGKDHSTVIHAVKKIEKQMATDTELSKKIEALKAAILQ